MGNNKKKSENFFIENVPKNRILTNDHIYHITGNFAVFETAE
ncbi:hypothetical protein CHCC20335_4145 [Bacillus paralicheniformis]|nr:hypothetical protein CHCC20335_4145 [Bacillus paralicheniformis]